MDASASAQGGEVLSTLVSGSTCDFSFNPSRISPDGFSHLTTGLAFPATTTKSKFQNSFSFGTRVSESFSVGFYHKIVPSDNTSVLSGKKVSLSGAAFSIDNAPPILQKKQLKKLADILSRDPSFKSRLKKYNDYWFQAIVLPVWFGISANMISQTEEESSKLIIEGFFFNGAITIAPLPPLKLALVLNNLYLKNANETAPPTTLVSSILYSIKGSGSVTELGVEGEFLKKPNPMLFSFLLRTSYPINNIKVYSDGFVMRHPFSGVGAHFRYFMEPISGRSVNAELGMHLKMGTPIRFVKTEYSFYYSKIPSLGIGTGHLFSLSYVSLM